MVLAGWLGWLVSGAVGASGISFDYQSGAGLSVSMNGVPVVRKSMFQFYEPGWTKGYYSSTYTTQTIERPDADTVRMRFVGADGRALGSGVFHREGTRLVCSYEFTWKGEKQANVELTAGLIWAPAFEKGSLKVEGAKVRSLAPGVYRSKSDMAERRYGGDASSFEFEAPVGKMGIRGLDTKLALFDARGYSQDFAEGRDYLWLGAMGIEIQPGATAKVGFELDLSPKPISPAQDLELSSVTRTLKGAVAAGGPRMPLVPKPTASTLDFTKPVLVGLASGAGDAAAFRKEALAGLARRFDETPVAVGPLKILVTRQEDAPVDSYRLSISSTAIKVALGPMTPVERVARRVALLAFVANGKLVLPTGTLEEIPATAWRGVHLFVGPKALAFHKKLWTNVLLPMGFNKVVLQCERTAWECLPNVRGGITMKRADLAALCDWYRSVGVEPIPLVQSFGHAEWLFAGKANQDIVFNPDVPYAVDPRKPRVKELFNKLWDEVISVTKAKTIHFGLDEVDMLGFPHDPKLVTELWKIQVPMLGEIAKRHGVQMMLWGDKGLAPGEAVDAALGDNAEEAAARRAVIPKGAFVADWHYKAEPKPSPFMSSLMLWEREGFQPVASAWFRPENIYGFNLAAAAHGFGTLQTTWAGYESSEEGMLAAPEQFSAMVLAGDYATSGREELPEKLGYDPTEGFRSLMYERKQSVRGEGGLSLQFGEKLDGVREVGPLKVLMNESVGLGSNMEEEAPLRSSVSINTHFRAQEVDLAVDTLAKADEGEVVARVLVTTSDGQTVSRDLRYGIDIRTPGDSRAVLRGERAKGVCLVRIPLGKKDVAVTGIRMENRSDYAGLRLFGVTAI
ncbi:MAG: hypothetical protein BGO01_06410 [Armatimonadetes bacterium 55-13]|nr:MAG: hypothetical protein BGO01_06410 [Armatimonadetes bacterium 55-13]